MKAFDKYQKIKVLIAFKEDELNFTSWSSKWSKGSVWIHCTSPEIEDCDFARWSDLENVEIITEEEFLNIRDKKIIYKRKKLSNSL